MKDLLILFAHLLTTIAKLLGPGGASVIVADSLLTQQQLLIINRTLRRSPKLTALDLLPSGFPLSLFTASPSSKSSSNYPALNAVEISPFAQKRKYRLLYSFCGNRKPGPKGPAKELIDAIIELKRRNPSFGCPRLSQQINLAFGIHSPANKVNGGPFWLTLSGQTNDSLWSMELFRCESIVLKGHWVLVIMDQFVRRIVGFGVHPGIVEGVSHCCMFNKIISTNGIPQRLSFENDLLFRYHQWQANLRNLDIEGIKSVPHTRTWHPFIERLIRTIRCEYLDCHFFWNTVDHERKLDAFRQYYSQQRDHQSLNRLTSESASNDVQPRYALLEHYSWDSDCNGLFQTPIAA